MKNLHPLVSFTYFITVLLFTMLLRNPVITVISLLGSVFSAFGRTSRAEKISDIKFYLPLAFLITLTNPIFSHNGITPLFFLNGNAFTLQALIYGVFIALMIVSVLLWSKLYSKTVTSDKFLYLFGKILPKTTLILSVSLRYIPLIKKDAKKIKDVQKTLGLYSTGSLTDNFLSSCKVYFALIGRTLENAVGTAESMKARGWGEGKRTPYAVYKFRKTDALLLFLFALISVTLTICAATGKISFNFYPAFHLAPVGSAALLSYFSFALLSLLPFIIETEVHIRWTLLRSKI